MSTTSKKASFKFAQIFKMFLSTLLTGETPLKTPLIISMAFENSCSESKAFLKTA